ncbi:SirB2 family protein [Pasteurella oralis]|uniref:SirB2 family protein n=1 Tax=Pasteurella oralis TaxID=1071947 RepID=A0ABW4NV67_9PAST|nr:SirB2 family protein [Pasteurella oralis]
MAINLIYTHIICAFLSLALLIIRATMVLTGKNWRQYTLLKILPHLTDTLLLGTGISLFILFDHSAEPFFIVKMSLIIMYIMESIKAFNKKDYPLKKASLVSSILCLVSVIIIAYFI